MKKIRILNLLPDIYTDGLKGEAEDRKAFSQHLLEETGGLVQLTSEVAEKGSASIEDFYDSAMVIPYICQRALKAQDEGYDAMTLDCFMDPGLAECRELVSMPIFGVCQSASMLAVRLGGEFAIIGILDDMDRCIKENLLKYGIRDMLVDIPIVDTPVLDLHERADEVVQKVIKASAKVVLEKKAKSVVFGCTGLSSFVKPVREGLLKQGIDIPIIEPMRAAVYDAITCAMMGVAHSKRAYAPVRPKKRILDWEK